MERIHNDIINIQKRYYDNHEKHLVMKQGQKEDIAKEICRNIDINVLLQNSCIVNDNHVTIIYPIIKMFCHTDNYNYCVEYMISKFRECINNYGSFSCTIDMNTFTISAAQRHKILIELFCKKCLSDTSNNYSDCLIQLNIENPPSVMEQLYRLFYKFIDPQVKSKIHILQKK
tara:strand:- start:1017 stop:1535 length:519 start_codon:yes stop_codon:yes gene_type:complete